jgi:hypothetical protein
VAAPLTFLGGRLGGVRFSVTQRRPSRWAPHEDGSSAGPLGQGELLGASSSPQTCCTRSPAAGAMTILRCRGEVTTRTTPTIAPIDRHAGGVAAPRRLRRRVFIGGDAKLPYLPPLIAVVVSISLGDLAFLVLCLARSTLLLRRGLVPIENCLLRERRFDRDEVGTL